MTRLRAGAATDVGLVRTVNQDDLLIAEPLYAVADGMGGHAAGEVAAQTAVEALRHALEGGGHDGAVGGAEELTEAVRCANRAVWDEAQANPDFRGMGTTLTTLAVVRIDGDEVLAVANVGDSRTYRLRGGELAQLTVDHSLVAELVAEGQIGADEAETHPQRHVLTRALGIYPDVDVDLLTSEPEPGDRYLLCSDGLSGEIADPQIASVLRRLADPSDAARELVAEAKQHGGSDNITVVVVDVLDEGDDPGPSPTVVAEAVDIGDPPDAGVPEVDITTAVPVVEAEGKGPAGDGPPAVPAVSRRERRALRRAAARDDGPRNRPVTVRVVLFLVLLLAVVGAGVVGTAWYARAGYYVGVRGGRITIYQGHPGGLLWWKPTIEEITPYTTSDVESYHLAALQSGVQEASLAAAQHYVARLRDEARSAGVGGRG